MKMLLSLAFAAMESSAKGILSMLNRRSRLTTNKQDTKWNLEASVDVEVPKKHKFSGTRFGEIM